MEYNINIISTFYTDLMDYKQLNLFEILSHFYTQFYLKTSEKLS